MGANAARGAGRGGVPWRILGWGAAALVLAAPLAAMRFTDDVAWSAWDFAFMAALLAAVGLALELAVRRSLDPLYRAAVGVALAAGFLLVWITGAVGLIGSEAQGANLAYAAVLAAALAGAAVARGRPAGLAWAMGAAAAVQALVPLAALLDPAARALVRSPEVPALTGGFVALWLASAWLFRKAAQRVASGAAA
jgi:hypothetical protein